MLVSVYAEPIDVYTRLSAIGSGLTIGILQESVRQGYLTRAPLTDNHPSIYFGFAMWAETVAALRNNLRPCGWQKSTQGNYELTVNSDASIAIAIMTGDPGTGLADADPSNKCSKGTYTARSIAVNNQLELDLFPLSSLPTTELITPAAELTTWILLMHVANDEVRFELSLPSKFLERKIVGWKERIIFPAIPRADSPIEVLPPALPEIDIQIKRKTTEA